MTKFSVRAWSGSPDDAVIASEFATVDEADRHAASLRASCEYKLISVVSESLGKVIGHYTIHQQGK